MRKGLTEVVFVLDRSGSMCGLEADTIGGFNSLIKKQRKEDGEALVSTVLFDDKVEILHDRVPIGTVKLMNEEQYYVRGCTALLDAIGGAVHHIVRVHKHAREEDRPEKTMFIIMTDGKENASSKYSYKKVRHMVEKERNRYGWEFLFLGANIDAIEEAANFGIRADRAVDFECDSEGVALNYEVLSDTVSAFRSTDIEECDPTLAGWGDRILEDWMRRGRGRR